MTRSTNAQPKGSLCVTWGNDGNVSYSGGTEAEAKALIQGAGSDFSDAETRTQAKQAARRAVRSLSTASAAGTRPRERTRGVRRIRRASGRPRARAPDDDGELAPDDPQWSSVRACRGCHRVFETTEPRQRYHDEACRNRAKQQRFRDRATHDEDDLSILSEAAAHVLENDVVSPEQAVEILGYVQSPTPAILEAIAATRREAAAA